MYISLSSRLDTKNANRKSIYSIPKPIKVQICQKKIHIIHLILAFHAHEHEWIVKKKKEHEWISSSCSET